MAMREHYDMTRAQVEAEVVRLREEVTELEAEAAHLRRGIETYRNLARIETNEAGSKWVAVAWGGHDAIQAAWTWEKESKPSEQA